jgi:hypothetical protein
MAKSQDVLLASRARSLANLSQWRFFALRISARAAREAGEPAFRLETLS